MRIYSIDYSIRNDKHARHFIVCGCWPLVGLWFHDFLVDPKVLSTCIFNIFYSAAKIKNPVSLNQ